MKKTVFVSAFVLFGTFAMANKTNVELEEKSFDVTVELEKECQSFSSISSCGGYFIACKEQGDSWDLVALIRADYELCDIEQAMGL